MPASLSLSLSVSVYVFLSLKSGSRLANHLVVVAWVLQAWYCPARSTGTFGFYKPSPKHIYYTPDRRIQKTVLVIKVHG